MEASEGNTAIHTQQHREKINAWTKSESSHCLTIVRVLQPLVPGKQNTVQHGFIQQEIPLQTTNKQTNKQY